jgi:hypothetical protein
MSSLRLRVVVTLLFGASLFGIACTHPDPSTPSTNPDTTSDVEPRAITDATCLGQGDGWCSSPVCAQPDGGIEHLPCCAGLAPVAAFDSAEIEKHGRCLINKGGRVNCVACGNGVCERGENKCNCPADCG